jgi:hypothetical protein
MAMALSLVTLLFDRISMLPALCFSKRPSVSHRFLQCPHTLKVSEEHEKERKRLEVEQKAAAALSEATRSKRVGLFSSHQLHNCSLLSCHICHSRT